MPEPTPPTESNEVLIERELERVVGEARQELDAATVIVAELRASADGFSERIATTSERLDQFDDWLGAAPGAPAAAPAAPAAPVHQHQPPPEPVHQAPPEPVHQAPPQPVAPPQPAPIQPQPQVHVSVQPPTWAPPQPEPVVTTPVPVSVRPGAEQAFVPPAALQPEITQFAAEAAVPQTRTISLTVAALSNLTVVSVVEAALLRITGVREVALRQLQGRKAILEVRLDENTGLISGLRKTLPLAFDVTESSDHSLEITLSYVGAPAQTTNGGGGAGPTLA